MYEYKLVNLAWHSRPASWFSRSQWNSSSHALEHFPHLGANLICCTWTADSPRASWVCRWAHTLPPMKGDPGDQEPCCSFFHSICTIWLHFVNTKTWAVYKDELEIHAGANIIAFSYSLQSLNCQSWGKRSHFDREPTLSRWAGPHSGWWERSISRPFSAKTDWHNQGLVDTEPREQGWSMDQSPAWAQFTSLLRSLVP